MSNANRNYATDYVVHAYGMGAACKQRSRDRVASELRADVTCKRCLASLAKRDREFRAKARRGIRQTLHSFALRGEAFVVSGYWDRDSVANAARAIAREEGRTL